MLSDQWFVHGVHRTVKAHAKKSEKNVYFYRFSVDGDLNMFKKLIYNSEKGAQHGDELGYLFKVPFLSLKPGSLEETVLKRMVKIWTNFAKTGKPIISKDQLLNVDWKPVDKNGKLLHFVDIGTKLVAGVNPEAERMEFWDELGKNVTPKY